LRVAPQEGTRKLENALAELGLSIIFVDHNRRIRSTPDFAFDSISQPDEDQLRNLSRHVLAHSERQKEEVYKDPERVLPFPLDQVLGQLTEWLRLIAIRAGYTGDIDASEVYLEVVRGLTKRRPRKLQEVYPDKASLAASLNELEKISGSYIRHGLTSEFPFKELTKLIDGAPESKAKTISSILGPFLDSIRKRLEALSGVQDIISTFENELNHYLRDKRANINVIEGLSLKIGEELVEMENLSSGELQLIFLFCMAVLAREKTRIIIIDEPEISLNYNWQRTFVQSLQRISSSARTQFLFATHSIEMIAKHEDSAVELI
jgi:ABC-type dipeptide/oligopeptide/nickel transport system ATPase subunit